MVLIATYQFNQQEGKGKHKPKRITDGSNKTTSSMISRLFESELGGNSYITTSKALVLWEYVTIDIEVFPSTKPSDF